MDPNLDWKALGDTWRDQPVPAIDPEAIGREIRRRGRRLRWLVGAEALFSALAIGLCAWIVQRPEISSVDRWVFIGLGAVLAVYQAGVLWLRRRQLRDDGRSVADLVELEIRRTRSGITYWRISLWTAMALWLGLALVVWFDASDTLRRGFWLMIAINGPMMLAAAVFIWWRGRRSLARITRFEALRDQLRGP
ncbi:hypothetical protein [Arenimonas terrae]|uniref:Uncharacterized protein n=1 Tax=Arenimonas terrae TaxID=2546226 RepID=A0A5C4RPY5_9GAMM|nr:hypothetical protein [Arenimonas terrae]TNJ32999.1 hypothetical protein E1B00_11835 [Arenimonas terrae]